MTTEGKQQEQEDLAMAEMDEQRPFKKQKNISTTLEELLELGEDAGVDSFKTIAVNPGEDEGDVKIAYFMKSPVLSFRHEGNIMEKPKVVFLSYDEDKRGVHPAADAQDNGEVVLYYSSSGSGKTVELAASSVTRNAHLTLILSVSSDVDEVSKKDRNKEAFKLLESAVDDLFDEYEAHSAAMKRICDASDANGLKLVLGLDEGVNCPTVVRSIIADRMGAAKTIRNHIKERFGAEPKRILFSIAGTGVASTTVGSHPGNFIHLQTSTVYDEMLYPRMILKQMDLWLALPGQTQAEHVTMQTLQEKLPILHCMMGNARMASIAFKWLYSMNRKAESVEEGKILDEVCNMFMKSNGLVDLRSDPLKKIAVGACAFAMMLFQWKRAQGKKIESPQELDTIVSDMECGFDFDETVIRMMNVTDSRGVRKRLIARYSLVEPDPDFIPSVDGYMEEPFMMRNSQQLIALHLLGIDLSKLVSANFFGFEILSTHTMKAALAASSAVALKDRPSVKKTLELVGCQVDNLGTHEDVQAQFNELDEYVVVHHQYAAQYKEKKRMSGTQAADMRKAGATMILPSEILPVTAERADGETNDGLSIYGTYQHYLEKAQYKARTEAFFPPLTAINYGSSSLADGFITCFVAKRDGEGHGNPVKFTCLNQAKDKLGRDGTPKGWLPMGDRRDNVTRCSSSVLDGVFGKHRLFLVSAPTEGAGMFIKNKGKMTIERHWIPRVVHNCQVLEELMGTLSDQRTELSRLGTYNVVVDELGKVFQDVVRFY